MADLHFGFDEIYQTSIELAEKIKEKVLEKTGSTLEELNKEDRIKMIGVARSGWIPAATIAEYLGIEKAYSVGSKSYRGKQKGASVEIYQQVKLGDDDIAVIVDEVVDSGSTMNELLKSFDGKYTIITAVLHVKPGRNFEPDCCVVETEEKSDWIFYPWKDYST